MSGIKPLVIGFYRADPNGLHSPNTASVAVISAWSHREGYLLGAPYRDAEGNGALETVLHRLAQHEDVVGVVVPSLDHLGPEVEASVARIAETGKQLFVANPTEARR